MVGEPLWIPEGINSIFNYIALTYLLTGLSDFQFQVALRARKHFDFEYNGI